MCVLGLGRDRVPPPHRGPDRGDARGQPPQHHPIHAADHRRVHPLLHIAPSKTDEERLLVISPELADVLSAVVNRIRGADGAVPLVPFYDGLEKIWSAPAPLLFQWTSGGQRRAVSVNTIRKAINEILLASGLTDASGQSLRHTPHDFRRFFTTEAIQNGMPPHIAQLLLGHKDINTTMGYKAIYPEEAINGHRAFIARRRALRPSEGIPHPHRRGVERVPRPLRTTQTGPGRLRTRLRHQLPTRARLRPLPASELTPTNVPALNGSETTSPTASPKQRSTAGSAKSNTFMRPAPPHMTSSRTSTDGAAAAPPSTSVFQPSPRSSAVS
ncbi:site-specific integrase [Actinomadura sp. NPDC048955]|uniref:tyrosine-type recombinase/integrase n=1 Tax=Actinomadura sp. NPDC048955 TaxID=3158228 RepID=UPI0033D9E0B0